MANSLRCYRCGASLEPLSLPLARLDECPSCGVQLHVCRMCVHYAPGRPDDCDEDDAPEVRDKRSANFCDYFTPNPGAYGPGEVEAEAVARERLEALFGSRNGPGESDTAGAAPADDAGSASADDPARRAAEELFKK